MRRATCSEARRALHGTGVYGTAGPRLARRVRFLPPFSPVCRLTFLRLVPETDSQLRVLIAREIYVKEVGAATAREHPDVALVGLGSSSEHALELISEIVREASCPVIAILHADDPAYIHEAARRGVFAYIVDGTPQELQSAIDITLQRFSEYQSLQGAFGRRALIEQAKGILMARHSINADTAFERLRDHSNTTAANSAMSRPPSSKATCYSSRPRRPSRPRQAPSLRFLACWMPASTPNAFGPKRRETRRAARVLFAAVVFDRRVCAGPIFA